MRVKLLIMYDGTGFCGWQIQAGRQSVQGEITDAIKKLTGETVSIMGSGRTDSGVHALAQVAHFDLQKPFDLVKIKTGLNFYLPLSIRIAAAEQAADDFNARLSAKSKTYFYLMYDAEMDNPLLAFRAHRVEGLDLAAMQAAAQKMTGRRDFKPFMSSGSEVKSTVRTVTSASVTKKDDFYIFEVSSNGFLYNMVRKMAAVLISVGQGKRSAEDVDLIFANGLQVKEIAPPHGLYLKKVDY